MTKTWARETAFLLGAFLCYLTYTTETEVADWITPYAFMFSVAYGAKQEVVKTIAERLKK